MGGRRQRGAGLMKMKFAQERNMADNIDQLAAYEEFKQKFTPELQKMLISGKSDVEILKKFRNFGAARLVHIIGKGSDQQALAAIRELWDRLDGKPTTKTENTHKFQKLGDKELDALLESNIASLDVVNKQSPEDESEDE